MHGKWSGLVKHLRSSLNMKQEAFAIYLGTTQATVSRWETGHQEPELRFRLRIADEIGKRDENKYERLFLSMLRNSPSSMSLVDKEQRFVGYSAGLQRALGPRIRRLQHQRLSDIITPVSNSVYVSFARQMFEPNCELAAVSFNDRAALQEGVFLRRCFTPVILSERRYLVCQEQPISPREANLIDLDIVTRDDRVQERSNIGGLASLCYAL